MLCHPLFSSVRVPLLSSDTFLSPPHQVCRLVRLHSLTNASRRSPPLQSHPKFPVHLYPVSTYHLLLVQSPVVRIPVCLGTLSDYSTTPVP